jgi:hypothetical protein
MTLGAINTGPFKTLDMLLVERPDGGAASAHLIGGAGISI